MEIQTLGMLLVSLLDRINEYFSNFGCDLICIAGGDGTVEATCFKTDGTIDCQDDDGDYVSALGAVLYCNSQLCR
jgi:hypothetical protein